MHICSLFLPPSHAAHDLVLWMGQERNESLWQCPAQLGKLCTNFTCFHISQQEKSQIEKLSLGPKLCCLGGKMIWVKLSYFSYPLQCIKTHISFSFNCVLELLLWKPGLLQRLSCPWVLVKNSVFQGLPIMFRRSWSQFMGHCKVHIWD